MSGTLTAPMGDDRRDHGGGLDAAVAAFGGRKSDWIDLSTGINPLPYPLPELSTQDWSALPDQNAVQELISAARTFWSIPPQAAVLAAPGASSLIARIPLLMPAATVQIATQTYNEHAASFAAQGWSVNTSAGEARVVVHPNNPTGEMAQSLDAAAFTIIDESFCDVCPDASLINRALIPNTIILKSFGKFWGLAGLRLGFAIGDPALLAHLAHSLGPWPVAGPALKIGTAALNDPKWAEVTRRRLQKDAERLDQIMITKGAKHLGGTALFRLYEVDDAATWQRRLAAAQIWSRIFPYNDRWLRLGLPKPKDFNRIERA